jgi:hypothetical protein
MNRSRALRRVLVGLDLALAACVAPRRPPESANDAPLRDSVPEKRAAERAAAPGLDLEAEDERWGVDAARERRRLRDEQKQKAAAAAATRTRTGLVPGTPTVPPPTPAPDAPGGEPP